MICLTGIVRDESQVIARCLRSVRDQLGAWVIVDTGSLDGTPHIIETEMAGLPGALHFREWRDFGANRSESLELADGLADWHLILDADEELVGEIEDLDLDATSYEIEVVQHGTSWRSARLLRDGLAWRYQGAVHAVPIAQGDVRRCRLDGVRIVHHADGGCKQGRRERNRALLHQAVMRDPFDARAWFYLAQECRDAGDLDAAANAYAQRAELGGWAEEVWYSRYQRGLLLEDPGDAARELELAYELRPQRLEAVHALTRLHRLHGRYRTAHLWAQQGMRSLAWPDDRLFVADWIYKWGLAAEYMQACHLIHCDIDRALIAPGRSGC